MRKRIALIITTLALCASMTACSPISVGKALLNGDIGTALNYLAGDIDDLDISSIKEGVDNVNEAASNAVTDYIEATEDDSDSESEQTDSSSEEDNTLTAVTYVRAKDGDTIVVEDDSGEEITVRLIGINTPESVSSDEDENCYEGECASAFTKAYLERYTTLYLQYDEDTEDTYGRTLAYVWVRNDVDVTDYDDFCGYNVGAVIMQNTFCEAVYYEPNGLYKDWYEKLEDEFQTDNSWKE